MVKRISKRRRSQVVFESDVKADREMKLRTENGESAWRKPSEGLSIDNRRTHHPSFHHLERLHLTRCSRWCTSWIDPVSHVRDRSRRASRARMWSWQRADELKYRVDVVD